MDKGKTAELLLEQAQIQQSNEAAANSSKISDAERKNFEEERSKLYKQIDERVHRLLCRCIIANNRVKVSNTFQYTCMSESYVLDTLCQDFLFFSSQQTVALVV